MPDYSFICPNCGTKITYRIKGTLPKKGYMIAISSAKAMSKEDSAHVFARDGKISDIEVILCVE